MNADLKSVNFDIAYSCVMVLSMKIATEEIRSMLVKVCEVRCGKQKAACCSSVK